MKSAALLVPVFALLLFPVAHAQQPEEILDVKPGILPDSPLYLFKGLFENIQLALTFDEVEKAKMKYRLARMRLAEALAMVEKNRTDLAEELLEKYERLLNETEEDLEKLKERRNVTDVVERVSNSTYRHLIVLQEVYQKVPPQAKPVIERVMRQSMERHKKIVENLDRRLVNVTITIGNRTVTEKVPAFLAKKFLEEAREFRKKLGRPLLIKERERLKAELMEVVNVTKEMAEEQLEEVEELLGEVEPSTPGSAVLIRKAQNQYELALRAFEEGRYGEAYGRAVSAEAMLRAAERMSEVLRERAEELAERILERLEERMEKRMEIGERIRERMVGGRFGTVRINETRPVINETENETGERVRITRVSVRHLEVE